MPSETKILSKAKNFCDKFYLFMFNSRIASLATKYLSKWKQF